MDTWAGVVVRWLTVPGMNPTERMATVMHVGYELEQMAGAAMRIDGAADEVIRLPLGHQIVTLLMPSDMARVVV